MAFNRDSLVRLVLECGILDGCKWDLEMGSLVKEKLGGMLVWYIDK